MRYDGGWVRRFVASLALCLFGCTERAPILVNWPTELEVAVVVREADERLELIGVAAVDGESSRRASLSFLLEASDSGRVHLHGWIREELLERLPQLDAESWWRIEAGPRDPSCGEARAREGGGWSVPIGTLKPRSYTLAIEGGVFEAVSSSASSLDEIAVEVPQDATTCRASRPSQIESLTDVSLPAGSTLAGRTLVEPRAVDLVFRNLLRIDADRILVQSYAALFVLQRGRRYADLPSEHIRANELMPPPGVAPASPGWAWSGVAVSRRDADGVVRAVYASASYGVIGQSEPTGGGVFELEIDESGLLPPVRTSTVYGRGSGPGAIASVGDGRYVAVGAEGLILSMPSRGATARSARVPSRSWFRRVLATEHPSLKHIAGSENGNLVVGDFYEGLEVVTAEVLGEVATPVLGLASVVGPSPRVVVGTYGSGLWQLSPGGDLQALSFQLGALTSCATSPDACGRRSLSRSNVASLQAGLVLATEGRCGELLNIDVAGACALSIPLGLDEPTALEASFGIFTVADTRGQILELRFPE